MNNIFLNQDPLLDSVYQQRPAYQIPIPPMQQPMYMQQERDVIDELDSILKNVSPEVQAELNGDIQWNELNNEMSTSIHRELMGLIKSRLNMNPNVIANAKKQIEIIKGLERKVKDNERRNINELNDYMKNYSHLSFDEYKKLKNDEN